MTDEAKSMLSDERILSATEHQLRYGSMIMDELETRPDMDIRWVNAWLATKKRIFELRGDIGKVSPETRAKFFRNSAR